jgi:dipeptidyl aminopeptidase/acylaminoacyl peptidase
MSQKNPFFVKSHNSYFLHRMGILLLTLVVALSAASPADAMMIARKISGPMLNLAGVNSYKFSPDSKFVVYAVDADVAGKVELFSVPAKGGEVIKLNAALAYGGRVNPEFFEITPDSQTVVYMVDTDGNSQDEIYRVPITGGTNLPVVGVMAPGRGVLAMQLSPLGDRVVYTSNHDENEKFELYSVPITGGDPVRLNPDLIAGGDVQDFQISPNGQRVVYAADQEVDDQGELYGNAIAGGAFVKLSGTMVDDGDMYRYEITANSQKVVFRADRLIDNRVEVFSNLLVGGGLYKLSGNTIPAGDYAFDFKLAPNSLRVVYMVYRSGSGKEDLYSNYLTDLDPPVKLNGPDPVTLRHFAITPNSLRVVYAADVTTDGVIELFSIPIGGGVAPVKLNTPLSGDKDVVDFSISPNSVGVAYRQRQAAVLNYELYLSATNGQGDPVELSALPAFGSVESYQFTPNSLGVVYIADQQTDGVNELYLTLGVAPARVSLPISNPAGDVQGFKISPNSQIVVYQVDQEIENKVELYAAFNGYGIFIPVTVR